ncbi:MAG: MBL fold metallo-hydrolase [Candidatus Limnocylindrales bacterium]
MDPTRALNPNPGVGLQPVVPIPAATVVLLRPGPGGLEALLTRRPSSMAFAADMHVFPGGRVDAGDADPRLAARSVISASAAAEALGGDLRPADALATYVAAIRESFEEAGVLLADVPAGGDLLAARHRLLADAGSFADLADDLDLVLRTDLLVPISRWVTPAGMARRFDARFFVAAMPMSAEASLVGAEVVASAWHRPREALNAMAAGDLAMWLPTSTTLQQLEYARSVRDIRDRATPRSLATVVVEVMDPVAADPEITRVTMPAGGGVAGQPIHAYLVGRTAMVLVDPGDPTGPGLDAAMGLAAAAGGRIVAVALTHIDPDHAAGAEAIAEACGVPVFAAPGRARDLPYRLEPLTDGQVIAGGDVTLRVVEAPGPTPDHLAFVIGERGVVLVGDLDGIRGARSIAAPVDETAWERSVARLRSVAPDARWLGGHPIPLTGPTRSATLEP